MVSTDSPWQAIISAALIGTERQPFQPPIVPGKLGDVLAHLPYPSPEAALLSAAATISLHQRVGWLPDTHPASPALPACPSDDLPRCSPRATRCLQQVLEGGYAQLLPEWLELATISQQRLPEIYLPALLDKGRQQRELRAAILPVLGQRGRWLAAQNPDWSYAVVLTTEADWETGTSAARLLALQDLRLQNPDRARDLLQSSWSQETASDRAKFLETLRIGLNPTDEPFLETALRDRSKEVRRVAADLLASQPGSRLCQQITEYTCRYLTLERHPNVSLQVQLPEQLDETLIQSGIEAKPTIFVETRLGEKAWWLSQMISATPLNTWTDQWQLPPQEIIKLTQAHEWQVLLLNGFALAAKRQRQNEWLEAILNCYFPQPAAIKDIALVDLRIEDLFTALSPDRRDALLINFLQMHSHKISDSLVIWLLRNSSYAWSVDLARLMLESLEKHLNDVKTVSNSDWELRSALKEFARFIPVILTSEFLEMRTRLNVEYYWMQVIDEFLALLQFRQELIQAFELEVRK